MSKQVTGLLGIKWDKTEDTLLLNIENVKNLECQSVSKRSILSDANRLFDPLRFVCPVTLLPRVLLQETWGRDYNWNDPVDDDI